MEVGQKVYIKPIGNATRCSKEIKEGTISKIGRKYFELKENYGRFFIDGMHQDGGQYISNYQCYLSLQEIEDEEELYNLQHWLRKEFSYSSNYSLKTLREVKKLLENERK